MEILLAKKRHPENGSVSVLTGHDMDSEERGPGMSLSANSREQGAGQTVGRGKSLFLSSTSP
jgi:hypothetical protein